MRAVFKKLIFVAFSIFIVPFAPLRAAELVGTDCRQLIVGSAGASSPWITNAKRNARIRWRRAVRQTATLDDAHTNWGVAVKELTNCDEVGYCCSRKKIWGVTWKKCTAHARPCLTSVIEDGVPRVAEAPLRVAPLVVTGVKLKAIALNRANQCPRRFVLRATVTATGTVGSVKLILKSGNDTQAVTLNRHNFEIKNGKRVAVHEFVRAFRGAVDRGYTVSIDGPTNFGEGPRRINPVRVRANCLAAISPNGPSFTLPTRQDEF